MNRKIIYLDHAATVPVLPEVLEKMLPYFTQQYGNPSAVYRIGVENRTAIEKARDTAAAAINVQPSEIYFTSCGTEADNWALIAGAEAFASKGRHIITSAIEHHAVLRTCQYLEEHGFEVTYLQPDHDGVIHPEALEAAIREDTILVSIMYANNEIGTIEPIEALARTAHRHGIPFHTDAVQAFCKLPIDAKAAGIDMMSVSAHKIGGPKGVGFLYIRKGLRLRSFLHGGSQERGRRAGTENVPGIVGFGEAIRLSLASMEENAIRERHLRDRLVKGIFEGIPYTRCSSTAENCLPGLANICFCHTDADSLLILLDMAGICVSAGSACTSGSLDPSHVLLAAGLSHEDAKSSVRFTIGPENTEEEIDTVLTRLKEAAAKLRSNSASYKKFIASQEETS